GCASRRTSIGLPSGMRLSPQGWTVHDPFGSPGIHGLSARGVYQATAVASNAGGLLHHLFTLASTLRGSAVSLSAALSVTPPSPMVPLPVRKHGALRCPDFPPSPCGKSGGAMH